MRIIMALLIIFSGLLLVACAGQASNEATQEHEAFPELAEIDAMLAELDELDRQFALNGGLEDLNLAFE